MPCALLPAKIAVAVFGQVAASAKLLQPRNDTTRAAVSSRCMVNISCVWTGRGFVWRRLLGVLYACASVCVAWRPDRTGQCLITQESCGASGGVGLFFLPL